MSVSVNGDHAYLIGSMLGYTGTTGDADATNVIHAASAEALLSALTQKESESLSAVGITSKEQRHSSLYLLVMI